jgi:7-cyano-7-deazaguanine synthase in queuosine biosynthesis
MDTTRIQDGSSIPGGEHEAESAISYVPFRNTYLLLLSATYAETKYPNKKVAFVIGANLTEGMVYLDNSTNYLKQFNNLIKVAGQFTNNFEVVAPFANMTKTKMLESYRETYMEDLLGLSFSCYFPKDGDACGECGSCILRNKAIKKINSKNE